MCDYAVASRVLDDNLKGFWENDEIIKMIHYAYGNMLDESYIIGKFYPQIYENAMFDVMLEISRFREVLTDAFNSMKNEIELFHSFKDFYECLENKINNGEVNLKLEDDCNVINGEFKTKIKKHISLIDGEKEGLIYVAEQDYDAIKTCWFTHHDVEISNSLRYLFEDYRHKIDSVYSLILDNKSDAIYKAKIVKDFCHLRGKLLNDRCYLGKKIEDAAEFDKENQSVLSIISDEWSQNDFMRSELWDFLPELYCSCFGNDATYILYCNWIITKKEEDLKEYLISLAVQAKIISTESKIDFMRIYAKDNEGKTADLIMDQLDRISSYRDFSNCNQYDLAPKIHCIINQLYEKENKNYHGNIEELKHLLCESNLEEEIDNGEYIIPYAKFLQDCLDSCVEISSPHRFFKNINVHNISLSSWITNFRTACMGENDHFKGNQSYKDFVGKMNISTPHTIQFENISSNMDFLPYIEMLAEIEKEKRILNLIRKVEVSKYVCAILTESYFLLKCTCEIGELANLYLDFENLSAMQEFVYGKNNKKYINRINKEEDDVVKKIDIDIERNRYACKQTIQNIQMFADTLVKYTNPCNVLDSIRNLFNQTNHMLGYDEVIEEEYDKLYQKIEDMCEKYCEGEYRMDADEKWEEWKKGITEIAKSVYAGDFNEEELKKCINNVLKYIATGDNLLTILNGNIDYSVIGLEYCKALEELTNYLFYIPMQDTLPHDSHYGKEESGVWRYKDTLEYGTMGILLKKIKRDEFNNYKACVENNQLSVDKLQELGKHMSMTFKMRNYCAHPHVASKGIALSLRNNIIENRELAIEDGLTSEENEYVREAQRVREILMKLPKVYTIG